MAEHILTTNITDTDFSAESLLQQYEEKITSTDLGLTFDNSQDKEHIVPPRFSPENAGFIPAVLPRYQFVLKQKWVGYVIDVSDDTFLARLVTIVGEDSEIEAEIYLEEVSKRDQDLIQPGATFYWSIGYNDTSGRQRVSEIRFRRLPPWTEEELQSANAEAAAIRALFNGE